MYIGAIDVGGTKTIVAVIDDRGKIHRKEQFPTVESDCRKHLDYCAGVLRRILEQMNLTEELLAGIGVTLPGIVDNKEGILVRAVYEKWEQVPVRQYLSESFPSLPVFCENDVNACALGEQYFGLGDRCKNYIWMTVSTGVGGAVVSEGRLLRGAEGYAGELGHLKVEYEHPRRCPCGQQGCLEAQGSGTALNRMVEEACQDQDFAAALAEISPQADAAACAILAQKGNSTAVKIFEQVGEYLGRGIAYCINTLNPQAVILGGGVAASLDLLMPGIKKAIEACAFGSLQDIQVLATPLGYEAALLGAAALVLQG